MATKEITYLLEELTSPADNQLTILEESVDSKRNKGGVKFRAILQEADTGNQNGRSYRKSALLEGIDRIMPRIKQGGYFCEMDHPQTKDVSRFTATLLKNSGHRILDLNWDGNLLIGECQTLSNRVGKDLRSLLVEDDIKIGFSLRALGKTVVNVKQHLTEVVSNMRMISYDSVSNPSHANALTQELLSEADLSAMLISNSERLAILSESAGLDLQELAQSDYGSINYDNSNNMVQICFDNTSVRAFLESHIHDEFNNSFQSLLNRK